MPEGRLARAREHYRCPMCGQDSLVGQHVRTTDALGGVRESCPTRLYSASVFGTIVVEQDPDDTLWGV